MKARVLMGELGGAVGTLASLGDKGLPVQKSMMDELGLAQPPIAWHTVRDTLAEVGCFLGLLCGSLDKIATDVKIMMMTELNEVQEPDGGGGRGASSTMPQKRNPISCAYITACSSVVRQHAAALLNAMNADFERATGTWEIEWLVLPEIFCYTAGAFAQAKFMLGGLTIHPENMMRNLQSTDGLVNTEAVMMALGPKMRRERRTTIFPGFVSRSRRVRASSLICSARNRRSARSSTAAPLRSFLTQASISEIRAPWSTTCSACQSFIQTDSWSRGKPKRASVRACHQSAHGIYVDDDSDPISLQARRPLPWLCLRNLTVDRTRYEGWNSGLLRKRCGRKSYWYSFTGKLDLNLSCSASTDHCAHTLVLQRYCAENRTDEADDYALACRLTCERKGVTFESL